MTLLDYIKCNYKTPNANILKNLGAESQLIKYLIETPWNTNFNIVKKWTSKESQSGRTVSLPIYYFEGDEGNEAAVRREDYTLLVGLMMPAMLEEGIEVKFMNEKVTSIIPSEEYLEENYTIVTNKGTHIVRIEFSGDYEYFFTDIKVDDEKVDSLEFNINTDKYFLIVRHEDDTLLSGLYDAGTEVVFSDEEYSGYSYYAEKAFGGEGAEEHNFDEERKFPALTKDVWYELLY